MHRVLILDSDPETLIKLQRALEDAGIDATITWDCAEASQLVENVPYDLMLIGDHPPDVDAAAVLESFSLRGTCPSALILRAINSQNNVDSINRACCELPSEAGRSLLWRQSVYRSWRQSSPPVLIARTFSAISNLVIAAPISGCCPIFSCSP